MGLLLFSQHFTIFYFQVNFFYFSNFILITNMYMYLSSNVEHTIPYLPGSPRYHLFLPRIPRVYSLLSILMLFVSKQLLLQKSCKKPPRGLMFTYSNTSQCFSLMGGVCSHWFTSTYIMYTMRNTQYNFLSRNYVAYAKFLLISSIQCIYHVY